MALGERVPSMGSIWAAPTSCWRGWTKTLRPDDGRMTDQGTSITGFAEGFCGRAGRSRGQSPHAYALSCLSSPCSRPRPVVPILRRRFAHPTRRLRTGWRYRRRISVAACGASVVVDRDGGVGGPGGGFVAGGTSGAAGGTSVAGGGAGGSGTSGGTTGLCGYEGNMCVPYGGPIWVDAGGGSGGRSAVSVTAPNLCECAASEVAQPTGLDLTSCFIVLSADDATGCGTAFAACDPVDCFAVPATCLWECGTAGVGCVEGCLQGAAPAFLTWLQCACTSCASECTFASMTCNGVPPS